MRKTKKIPFKETEHIENELEKKSQDLLATIEDEKEKIKSYSENLSKEDNLNDYVKDVNNEYHSYLRANLNIAKAQEQSFLLANEIKGRWEDLKQSKSKSLLPKAPSNTEIDYIEESSNSFAKKVNIYKILVLLCAGSLLGVVIEEIWCLLKNGYLESRASLVIGPFNPLYGFGALIITGAVYKYRNNTSSISFLAGLITGSVFEYLCSYFQELLLGSTSWDYSALPYNLNGRICLLYSIFWGVLSVVWIKSIYPRISKLLVKFSGDKAKTITWIFFIFLLLDSILSIVACARWKIRLDGGVATNIFEQFIDNVFNNEYMQRVYANMVFK